MPSSFAGDLGLQMSVGSRLGLGLSARNLGGKMSYLSEGDSLPLIYSAGMSYLLVPGNHATMLMVDAPYRAHEKQLLPSAGLETRFGPLALRVGYMKTTGLQNQVTVGAGFLVGGTNLDYSFGMVDQLQS